MEASSAAATLPAEAAAVAAAADSQRSRVICLFDVDGTLTAPRHVAPAAVTEFLAQLRGVVSVGVVGGSDLVKQQEQLGHDSAAAIAISAAAAAAAATPSHPPFRPRCERAQY